MFPARLLPAALLLALLVPPTARSADAAEIDEVDRLMAAGAPRLALRVVDAEQPELAERPVAWQDYERRRLADRPAFAGCFAGASPGGTRPSQSASAAITACSAAWSARQAPARLRRGRTARTSDAKIRCHCCCCCMGGDV